MIFRWISLSAAAYGFAYAPEVHPVELALESGVLGVLRRAGPSCRGPCMPVLATRIKSSLLISLDIDASCWGSRPWSTIEAIR